MSSILSDSINSEFPFEMSREEIRIVSHFKTSTLILGRSGTGKTTCLIFKILTMFKARSSISDEAPFRQVSEFVPLIK